MNLPLVTTPSIHAARVANLRDGPPELGEALGDYIARIVREFGTTYRDAARDVHQGVAGREARAEVSSLAAITKAMRKPGT